jgi:hypothetical protein
MDEFNPGGASDFEFEMERMVQLAAEPARRRDNELHIRFYKHAELNSFESKKAGRKIFEDKVYIRILSPANRLSIIERAASDDDKLRFQSHYQRFMAGQEQMTVGTPISELPTITRAQVLELQALKVETVEQLAAMADQTTQLLGTGGADLKRRAQVYLDRLNNSEELSKEVRSLKMQLELLQKEKLADAAKSVGAEVKVTTKA